MATANYDVAPEDGWTSVATDPTYLRISAVPSQGFFVAVDDSTPAADDIGIYIRPGEVLEVLGTITGGVYVRVNDPLGDKPCRIDVLAEEA